MECEPFLPSKTDGLQTPSAPPSTVSPIISSARPTVQPFNICQGEVVPIAIIDEGHYHHVQGRVVDNHNHNTYQPAPGHPLYESQRVNAHIEYGNYDGLKIVHNDHEVAARSTIVGSNYSSQINSKVEASNRDRVEDLTIKSVSAPPTQHHEDIFVQMSNHTYATSGIPSYPPARHATGGSGGYQIQEYKSVYESGATSNSSSSSTGGYQFSEYKSIYD